MKKEQKSGLKEKIKNKKTEEKLKMETTTLILNHRQIQQKIRRMAYQIYESNSKETEIILAGIMNSGYKLAVKIEKILSEISDIEIKLCQLKIDKKNPLSTIECSFEKEIYRNKVVVLADDVLNSGSTLIYRSEEHTSELQSRFDLVVEEHRLNSSHGS